MKYLYLAAMALLLAACVNNNSNVKNNEVILPEGEFTYNLPCKVVYVNADEYILQYLKESGTKAVALFPVCYKANLPETIKWIDCYDDVKHIIDDYADKGLIDTTRVYVTGSSDGGRGARDYAQMHPDAFAAAISMSCSSPRPVNIPVYFFSTASEVDCTTQVAELVKQGVNIKYKYCPGQKHGGDAIECTPELLKEFFSHTKSTSSK